MSAMTLAERLELAIDQLFAARAADQAAVAERLDKVRAWSLRIHDAGDARHRWCMATAEAMVAGGELPASGRGTAFTLHGTANTRRETIARILGTTTTNQEG